MRLNAPDQRVIEATEDAVAWLRRARLLGTRLQRISAPETDFGSHTERFDVIIVSDSDAKPIWARHYEIETDRPVFAGRDSVKRYSLREIERERRTGTPWYGNWPSELLERDFPAWQRKLLGRSESSTP